MLEATPGAPFGPTIKDLLIVETDMIKRRQIAMQHMKSNEFPITLTSFPRLGCPGVFTDPFHHPTGEASRSQFVPDEIINTHPRFRTLTANIRSRRGRKVAMNKPIFEDRDTPRPFNDPTVSTTRTLFPEDKDAKTAAQVDHVYMDSMGFGMGCCCLQITFQAKNISEARQLYDQLAPLGPIMMALTAGSPIWRGYLSDDDCRWNVISGAVDDRTESEMGLKPLFSDPDDPGRFVIPKSRYSSIDCYISNCAQFKSKYNDTTFVKDDKIQKRLVAAGDYT